EAIALASPTLAGAKAGPARHRALTRYARRAAFRATPSGLLAGVCVGVLGARTDVASGAPAAHLGPSWSRIDALARELIDDPAVRDRVCLRRNPSVSREGAEIRWIALGGDGEAARAAELDARLGAVLDATDDWTLWPIARARAEAAAGETGDLDELLLALVDDEVLATELAPPLIGPPPAVHLRDRLAAIGCVDAARAIDDACALLAAGELARGRDAWAALPGRSARDLQAVLIHRPRRTPRLSRAAVARAARLTPLLVRLQEALAPPAAERFTSGALAAALDASTEIFGAGAFDLEALAAGDYGVDLEGDEDVPATPAPPPALLALLVDAIAEAARERRPEAVLDADALEAALADLAGTPLPPTAELFLTPAPHRARARPGTGWLIGLHAPAGASLGRFLHALGAPLAETCAEIAAAEHEARPDEERVDVAFAPSAELADLTAHPPIRRRALALSRWTGRSDDLTARELLLAADPARPEALALQEISDDQAARAIVPSPLARVRSATAPPGAPRLLVGWSLQRQHTPWAFAPGPLANLAFLPRLVVDGFVLAPASWRLPPALRSGRARRAALARWRRAAGVPRMVQVGTSDELYPVDLEAPDAGSDLREHERVIEIWPPLDATVDRDGRRIEAIVPVVDDAAPPPAATRLARVPPPRRTPPLAGWRTFKLFGASARQDTLLTESVVPAVAEARRGREIDAWFFLRYLDGPGERPHLRLRVHATDGDPAPFERRLRAALARARAAGTLASIETGDYFPERGRFVEGELTAVHAIFESDSEAVAALAADPELDRIAALPLLHDALARGLGLDLAARHTLARARRQAAEGWTAVDAETRRASDAAFRRNARALRAALAEQPPLYTRHEGRVVEAAGGLTESSRARLLPTLLHLEAVRLVGPDPDAERLGYTFWERALEGLRKTR
ncbi:MAG TPA: thiopeptide-type bacteriocin biosynthesis protein, partial [Polyangia bacterium]